MPSLKHKLFILERMHALVPNETLLPTTKIVARTQPFEMLYSLNCQNLCADFQEDLEFKFSWGITSMIQRFTGKMKERNSRKQPAILNRQGSIMVSANKCNVILSNSKYCLLFFFQYLYQNPVSPITPGNDTPLCLIPTPVGGISQEQLSLISRFALTSIGSQGTVGGLIVAGIVCIHITYKCGWTDTHRFINIYTFRILCISDAENNWLESFGGCWCSIWLHLFV